MRPLVPGLAVFLLVLPALAQEPESPSPESQSNDSRPDEPRLLGELVVTATRGRRATLDLPRAVTVVDEGQLAERNRLVALDTLDDRIGVWVEKRSAMSSDPVVRGLSGGNVLALVDGNSLTTLWGEGGYAGDDLYGKVDGESIERIELVRGPSSVLYGSNALGGVIQFFTRKPPLDFTAGGMRTGGRLKFGYESASDYVLGRGDVWGAGAAFRYRLGFSARDAGDVRGGGSDGLQAPSGGSDRNFDWSSEFDLGNAGRLEVTGARVNRNWIPRYYRPTQTNFNDRSALSVTWKHEDEATGEGWRWSVFGQDKKDVRLWLDQDKRGVARWKSLATDLQARRSSAGGEHFWTFGAHLGEDRGESPDDEQFTITTPATGTQKASPDSTWQSLGLYAQDEWTPNDTWSFVASARVDRYRFVAADNPFWTIPGSTAAENVVQTGEGTFDETALTGGLGAVRTLEPDWTVYGSWARGFRLFPPGFGLRQTGFGILAPTDGFLDPVTADQFELGTRVVKDTWWTQLAAYTTRFHDFQQPTPGSYRGMSSFDLDGSGTIEGDETIYVVGSGSGDVTGLEVETGFDLARLDHRLDGWSLENGFMTNHGRVHFQGGSEPLRHTHPDRWVTRLRFEDPTTDDHRWLEFTADFVDRFDAVSKGRLNSDVGYLKDPQDPSSGLLRPFGLPGYSVFDLRGGLDLSPSTRLTLGIENIGDKKYRTAHSRMDAPGRSLLLGLEVRL